jgi:hypothetical protein
MPATLTGIPLASIGQTYDIGIAQNPFTGNTQAYGYMLAAGTEFVEATDLQDDEHLVQVASPAQSDKFSRYPKISQGSWVGGEEQLLFTDDTRYYQSSKLECAVEGHLRILGNYHHVTIPGTVGAPSLGPGSVAIDPSSTKAYFGTASGATNNEFNVDLATGTVVAGKVGTAAAAATVNEILAGPDGLYFAVAGEGIFQVGNASPINTGGDTPSTVTGRAMAYVPQFLNDEILYWHPVNAAPDQLYQLLNVSGWPVAPVSILTVPWNESVGYLVTPAFPTGLIIVIGQQLNPLAAADPAMYVYSWDGTSTNPPTLIGIINGYPVDVRTFGGSTFLLVATTGALTTNVPVPQPTIYQISSNQIQLWDDYRYKQAPFQAVGTSLGSQFGRLDGDVNQLYMSWPTIGVKRYDLTSGAKFDVGDPYQTGQIGHSVAVGPNGTFVEYSGDNAGLASYCIWGPAVANNDTGTLTTSYFDAGVPGIVKYWKSFEVELNGPLSGGAAVSVQYRLDNTVAFTTLTMQTDAQGNLIGFFPAGTKAKRIQMLLTLTASSTGTSPDIRSYSIYPTTGRIWRCTVMAMRNIQTHAGDDNQAARPVDLIANIENVYNSGGRCILYVPDPTAAGGVSQVNAILQDYTRRSKSPPGPRSDEFGAMDQEAEIDLVFSEDL